MPYEHSGLRAVLARLSCEKTTMLDQLHDAVAMFWVVCDGEYVSQMFVPEGVKEFVVVEGSEEELGYFVEKPDHFSEMDPVLFLLDFLFAHHLHLKVDSDIRLSGFHLFGLVDFLLD